MPRAVRSEFDGAWYHVLARGNQRQAIFACDKDRESMLSTLGDACTRTGWEVHAWVLMPNHFHFVIRTPQANLVAGMQWLMNAYTRRFNCRHRRWGRLFGDRYKSLVIEPPEHAGQASYLRSVMWYVHLNPVRAGLVTRNETGSWNFDQYPWNSLVRVYGVPSNQRPTWCSTDMAMGMEQLRDSWQGRRTFLREANQKANAWLEQRQKELGTKPTFQESMGWFRGSKEFRDWLLDRLSKNPAEAERNVRSSDQARDYSVKRAEELIRIGLDCFGLDDTALRSAKGSDARRLLIAEAIWKQTTVGQTWIAERLGMKSAGNVCQQLRRGIQKAKQKLPPKTLDQWEDLSKFVT